MLKSLQKYLKLDNAWNGTVDIAHYCSIESDADKNQIVGYLRDSAQLINLMGYYCNAFTGQIADLGITIYSDGNWVWDSIIVYHYEKYNLQLPEDFIEHMRRNEWILQKFDEDLTWQIFKSGQMLYVT